MGISFCAKDQRKYSVHNIDYCKLDDFSEDKLKNLDIIYFPSPGMGLGRIKKITTLIKNKYPYVKIIGAYAGENKLLYPNNDLIVSISAKHLQFLREAYQNSSIIFLPESIDVDFFSTFL